MSSPPPSVTVRSGTAPRKPGRYCSDSGDTFIRGGGGGGADVDTCNGFSREVTVVEEISLSAVGFDRVAAIVKRFLFLEVVAVVWVPVKVGGAKWKCGGVRGF